MKANRSAAELGPHELAHQVVAERVPARLSTTGVELRKLLAGSRGEVIVARRLTHEEASMFERRRVDCDADAHASLIPKEEAQFRRPRRGDNRIEFAKLAVREAPDAGDEFDKHRGGA